MPKLKAPLMSLNARGRLGKLFALVRRRGQNIIERRPIPTDAKSPAQLFSRHMFSKCVDLWHLLSEAERQEWESLARPLHMTGYAWYISQCLRPNPGIYLPLQGGVMTGDIDMGKNRLLKLPAPTDGQEAASKGYTDLNSMFFWKDESQSALYDANRTVSLGFTALSLTAKTSPGADVALLRLSMRADVVGTGSFSMLYVRKKGTTPSHYPIITLDKSGTSTGVNHRQTTLLGLDTDQSLEYGIMIGTNWQCDSFIDVLGYIEL